ncbi:MAG: ornithine cyclodeaminase family protein [Clostridia bacterium]|nr:ornithine cyclodeaminase family protein [Clostridia bacterium]
MFNVRVLNHETIESILDMQQVIEGVEKVYTLKAESRAEVFPMVFHEFERGVADMDIKSGHLKDADIFGLKLVSWYGDNPKQQLPALIGTTLVFDSATGKPIGLLSADYITGMRTGAAAAIGAKVLARKNSKTLLMVGTGHISIFAIAATLMTMDHIKTVKVYDPMDKMCAERLVGHAKEKLEQAFLAKLEQNTSMYESIKRKFDVSFEVVEDLESATGVSDIILTATPSRKPMIMAAWVKPGTHFSCIGSDMSGKQEIDEKIFGTARIFVDDVEQAIHVGETEMAINTGTITKADIIAEIGCVMTGDVKGRQSDTDITVFDTTGIALQDLMTAKLALDIAEEKNMGTIVDL